MKILAVLAALALVVSGFYPWIVVESKQLVLTGVDAMDFGKPAYLHFFFSAVVVLTVFLPYRWAQLVAVLSAALNAAWAIRNFLLLSACPMGDCPARQPAFYVMLAASLLMLVAVLFRRIGVSRATT